MISAAKPALSILIPVYNEANGISPVIRVLEALMVVSHEIVVIYDFDEDSTVPVVRELQKTYPSVRLLKNSGRGVVSALKTGFAGTDSEMVCIYFGDDIGPTIDVNQLLQKMEEGYDVVSATRYRLGGKRYGGRIVPKLLSITANRFFQMATGFPLSDLTTALKLFRRPVLDRIKVETDESGGWSMIMEITVKAYLEGFRLAEVPIVSVDRIYGGASRFRVAAWMPTYLRWFILGIKDVWRRRLGLR